MAWSWSYSNEGINNIRNQIHAKDREWLEICWAENYAAEPITDEETGEVDHSSEPELNSEKYEEGLQMASEMAEDVLADAIFDFACEIATSSNGGWEAY